MGQIIVRLSKDEVGNCLVQSQQRFLMKWGSVDRLNYTNGKAKGLLEHDLLNALRAAIGEWAVAKHFNLTWNYSTYPNDFHHRRKSLPDVGVNGEVRTIRTQTGIPFWEKDKGKVIYGARVLDEVFFSEVELFQPFFADDFMLAEYADPAIGGWRVPISKLSPTQ